MFKETTITPEPNAASLYSKFVSWHINEINSQATQSKPKDYMEFPLQWDRSRPLVEHLYYNFEKYVQDLTRFKKEYVVPDDNTDYDSWIDLDEIEAICNNILDLLNKSVKGEFICFYELSWLTEILQTAIFEICPPKEGDQSENRVTKEPFTFYRMRGERNLYEESQFYHVPFDKIYLSASERFSASGYPCLYLGYSKECCIKELGQQSGSIVKMELKKSITILDFTIFEDYAFNNQTELRKDFNMFMWWPILAACYVTPTKDAPKERFKEEYLFPQLITKYVKQLKNSVSKFLNVEGIRYYSCREPRLNPSQPTYMNLVLFPKYQEENGNSILKGTNLNKPYDFQLSFYDYDLIGKFEFDTPTNV